VVLPVDIEDDGVVLPVDNEDDGVVLPVDNEDDGVVLPVDNEDDGVVLPVDDDNDNMVLPVDVTQVNGNDVRHSSHQETVTFLIAPVQDIYLTVRHDPSPPGLQVCHLVILLFNHYIPVCYVHIIQQLPSI